MEQETLQSLLALFAQLGGDAKWAFLAYLTAKVLIVLVVCGMLLTIVLVITRAIAKVNTNEKVLRNICDALDVRYYEADTKALIAIHSLKAHS